MAIQASTPMGPVISDNPASYIDWPAVLAGAVLAAAVAFVLLAFGSALGLTIASPYRGESASFKWFAIAAGLWLVWVHVSSSLAGGYLTGRMRRRIGDATEHESDVRDGVHGLLVWAVGILISGLLTFGGIAGIAKSAAEGAGSAVSGVAQGAGLAAAGAAAKDDGADRGGSVLDRLFRTDAPRDSATIDRSRGEIGRVVTRSLAKGEFTQQDRSRIVQVVAAETGMTQAEAEARVNQTQAEMKAAADRARDAAERARKIGILAGFVTAASLLIAAAAAFFAGGLGGRHRDEGTIFAGWGRV